MARRCFTIGLSALIAGFVQCSLPGSASSAPVDRFDIAPFVLPNCAAGEYIFEEPRDIESVVVRFRHRPPESIQVHYLRKTWPEARLESANALDDPCGFGWMPIDDWFNGQWHEAAIDVHRRNSDTVVIRFKRLTTEFPEAAGYDVTFRRSLALKIDVPDRHEIVGVRIFTTSAPAISRLRVEFDAGKRTAGRSVRVTGYNASIGEITALRGVRVAQETVQLSSELERSLEVRVSHMRPANPYCNDAGLVTFALDEDTFTISLRSLEAEGPIWYADQGLYVAFAGDPMRYEDYRRSIVGQKTLNQRVVERREQTYAGAAAGQPRPHAVSTNLGWAGSRHRFRLESNGDLVLHKWNVTSMPGEDTARFKCDGDARWFFDLERQAIIARYTDTPPVLAYNLVARDGDIAIEQKSLAVPLTGDDPPASGGAAVALLRFRFENLGDRPAEARLPVSYSHRSVRSQNAYAGDWQDDYLVPRGERDSLFVQDGDLRSRWREETVLRARWESAMTPGVEGRRVVFRRHLQPGESCELLLKVPFIALDSPPDLAALDGLQFDRCYRVTADFWRTMTRQGAQLACPEPHLTALHASHLSHVSITDSPMPEGGGLVNTSVGTSTYGNFANEACMVIHELDQRGLHEEARRRIEVWIKYQGTAPQPGKFTDYDGMYFGAGGFESGDYNQHHGWVLWCIGMHYFLTGDAEWLERIAPSLIAGCDWVFRQRRNTMGVLPHSRGWEHGFLPAGSLEDVTDFHYWLSTNALTWRGVDTASKALAAAGHPEAPRIRREADAYRTDLRRGFETMRQHAPVVRLRDGRWVPHYPSRLYWRGRDIGWIREVLEGAMYLPLSGLYDASGPQAQWILDDYQDNRYVKSPYGYPIVNFEANWFDRGGFSIQPNLLAGLIPHLDRDEPEIFLWMFFNAWSACYREEINAMVEHPNPELGHSTAAHFKTSDESNAISWLRGMFVYTNEKLLHIGRALPREWLASGRPCETSGVCTPYGTVDVSYRSKPSNEQIAATLDLRLRRPPPAILVRFRHPEQRSLRSVRVNGEAWNRFDPQRNDVDITGFSGRVEVLAEF